MTVEELPNCSICGNPMVRLKEATERKQSPIYVCNKGREQDRMPCDGFVHDISVKNS
jgi:hypothetical protein